jgi:hypothetical protein
MMLVVVALGVGGVPAFAERPVLRGREAPRATDLLRAEKLAEQSKAIVLNSPIRWGKEKAPKDVYSELFRDPKVSIVLTGTRHHLSETVGYV